MEAAGAHWEPLTIPCGIFPSASWQSFQHQMCCDGQCKISNAYLTGVPSACRAGGFLGRWPHKPCQQKSDPLISPWNSSSLSQAPAWCNPSISHWFWPTISKQIPKKTMRTPNLPQVQSLAWNVLLPVAPKLTPSNAPLDSREAAHIYSRQEPGPEQKFRYFVTL